MGCYDLAVSAFVKPHAISGQMYLSQGRSIVRQSPFLEAAGKRALMPGNCQQ